MAADGRVVEERNWNLDLGESMKLILPDAIWRPDIISGAGLLYFRDEAVFVLHPSASTHLANADPFSFFEFVEERQPVWGQKFFAFVELWRRYQGSLRHTFQTLQPLRDAGFQSMLLSYPRHDPAMEAAGDLLKSSSLDEKENHEAINRFVPEDKRPIPFTRMIFIGDGDTDIPAMKMVTYKEGYSIAVYDPKRDERALGKIHSLISDDRVDFVAQADYSENSQIDIIVRGILGRIARQDGFQSEKVVQSSTASTQRAVPQKARAKRLSSMRSKGSGKKR